MSTIDHNPVPRAGPADGTKIPVIGSRPDAHPHPWRRWRLLVPLMALLFASSLASAQGNMPDLIDWTVDNGGGALSGGDFSLQGTFGQADAGRLSGGDFRLQGGFWAEGRTAPDPTATATISPGPSDTPDPGETPTQTPIASVSATSLIEPSPSTTDSPGPDSNIYLPSLRKDVP